MYRGTDARLHTTAEAPWRGAGRPIDVWRETAREAGRDPAALEYTRWGSMGMSAADVEDLAGRGVTRVVLGVASPGLDEQREEMSAFAARLGLAGEPRSPHV